MCLCRTLNDIRRFSVHMKVPDPYTPGESHYECTSCGSRMQSSGTVENCSNCGDGAVRNIAVPRE
ncbi:rubrerythrin-like domain-containing protein [Haloarculaceae archaeon H-GB2-1]|nr:rubrerythrin-like domain-containing protein [Haloarculaceae archaeon H-GB11]MEA5408000.1 rubrerythrin-like domain-containing protein [Haloarculaceae archaeon H-GB2-1]